MFCFIVLRLTAWLTAEKPTRLATKVMVVKKRRLLDGTVDKLVCFGLVIEKQKLLGFIIIPLISERISDEDFMALTSKSGCIAIHATWGIQ